MDTILVEIPHRSNNRFVRRGGEQLWVFPEVDGLHLCLNDETNVECQPLPKETYAFFEPETGEVHYTRLSNTLGASYAPKGKVAYGDYSYSTFKSGIKSLVYLGEHDPENPFTNIPVDGEYLNIQVIVVGLKETQLKKLEKAFKAMFGLPCPSMEAKEEKSVCVRKNPPTLSEERLIRALMGLEHETRVKLGLAAEKPKKPKSGGPVGRVHNFPSSERKN